MKFPLLLLFSCLFINHAFALINFKTFAKRASCKLFGSNCDKPKVLTPNNVQPSLPHKITTEIPSGPFMVDESNQPLFGTPPASPTSVRGTKQLGATPPASPPAFPKRSAGAPLSIRIPDPFIVKDGSKSEESSWSPNFPSVTPDLANPNVKLYTIPRGLQQKSPVSSSSSSIGSDADPKFQPVRTTRGSWGHYPSESDSHSTPTSTTSSTFFATPPSSPQSGRESLSIRTPDGTVSDGPKRAESTGSTDSSWDYILPSKNPHHESNEGIESPALSSASSSFPWIAPSSLPARRSQDSWGHYLSGSSSESSTNPSKKIDKTNRAVKNVRDSANHDAFDSSLGSQTRDRPVPPAFVIKAADNFFVGDSPWKLFENRLTGYVNGHPWALVVGIVRDSVLDIGKVSNQIRAELLSEYNHPTTTTTLIIQSQSTSSVGFDAYKSLLAVAAKVKKELIDSCEMLPNLTVDLLDLTLTIDAVWERNIVDFLIFMKTITATDFDYITGLLQSEQVKILDNKHKTAFLKLYYLIKYADLHQIGPHCNLLYNQFSEVLSRQYKLTPDTIEF